MESRYSKWQVLAKPALMAQRAKEDRVYQKESNSIEGKVKNNVLV